MRADVENPTMTPVLTTVERRRLDLVDTVTLTMSLADGSRRPEAGQFAMLWVPGVGEVPISYSSIGPDRRVDHTVRAVGATTTALTAMSVGGVVGIRGPFGRGWQLDRLRGRDLLIIAGGLGLAPLRPVIEAAASGALRTRSTRVLIGARTPDTLLYAAESYSNEVGGHWGNLDTRVTVDSATTSWHGAVGPITRLLDRSIDRPDTVTALVCGPEIMMAIVSRTLVAAGVDDNEIQVSLERNMACGVGRCGHCQLGSLFPCVDGPVVDWAEAAPLLAVRER